MVTAITVTVLLGLPAGVVGAVRQDRWPDYVLSVLVVGLLAIPTSGWA